MVAWMTGTKAPVYPLPSPAEQANIWRLASGFVRYFIAGDPNFDPRKFRPEDFRTRVEHISALMDSTDPDLSRFAARSGKLILKENMSDHAISPFNAVAYYKSLVDKLGQTSVDSFMRFFVTPGANHGGGGISSVDGAALPQGVDLLDAIDNWGTAASCRARSSKLRKTRNRPLASRPHAPCAAIRNGHATWAVRRRTLRAFRASGKAINERGPLGVHDPKGSS
jgi:feruloyl esterase